jgi:hypothetical protein
MKVLALVAMLASLGGACGDGRASLGGSGGSGSSGGSDAPDGGSSGSDGGSSGSDGGVQAPPRITVVTGGSPALIVYREEATTEWKTPASPSTGRFEFEVTGPYRVVVVCAGEHSAAVTQFAQTPDDERTIEQPCGSLPEFPFHVTGQMQQSGAVGFGLFGRGQSNAPWSFDLPAAAGTFDFLAFFGSLTTGFDHFEIRRDLAVAADLDLGTLDVAQEPAQALVPTRFTASNLAPEESLMSVLDLQSGNTSTSLFVFSHPELAWQVNLVPGAALRATDTQDVQLTATSSSGTPMQQRDRAVIRRVRDGGSTSVALMDPIGPTTLESTTDRLVATWAALPEHDQIDLFRQSFSSDFSRFVAHDFLLSRGFLAAAGVTTATLDVSDVPGFRPEWGHDPALEQVLGLDVVRGASPDDLTVSEVSEDIPAPTTPGTEARRVDPQRTMAQIRAHRTQLQRLHRATRPRAR